MSAGVRPRISIHGIRPVDAPAREVPVPQPAAAAAQRRVDAFSHALAEAVGVARPGRLPEIGEGEGDEDKGGRADEDGGAKGVGAPSGDDRRHGIDDGHLPEGPPQRAHRRERVGAVGEIDAQHPRLFGEDGERLRGAEIIVKRALDAERGGGGGDDLAGGIGDEHLFAAGEGAGRYGVRKGRLYIIGRGLLKRVAQIVGDDGGEKLDVSQGAGHRAFVGIARHRRRCGDQDADEKRHHHRDAAPSPNIEWFESGGASQPPEHDAPPSRQVHAAPLHAQRRQPRLHAPCQAPSKLTRSDVPHLPRVENHELRLGNFVQRNSLKMNVNFCAQRWNWGGFRRNCGFPSASAKDEF